MTTIGAIQMRDVPPEIAAALEPREVWWLPGSGSYHTCPVPRHHWGRAQQGTLGDAHEAGAVERCTTRFCA